MLLKSNDAVSAVPCAGAWFCTAWESHFGVFLLYEQHLLVLHLYCCSFAHWLLGAGKYLFCIYATVLLPALI